MEYYLVLSVILFAIGVVGVISRKNIIIVLMSLELCLNAVNINFVTFSSYLGDMTGRIFAIFTMAVAAAEVAVGLAIAVNLFKVKKSVIVEDANTMKG
ncbi:MAG: NADH-quinone oxidoreductase subunit NuoK [Proteobacteria bacterium]|nr:NADH-quinone oxidoreductase subunit NuoK [Pseudomonadota bacterium]